MFILDSMAFIHSKQLYQNLLIAYLNSNLMTFYFKQITPAYSDTGFRLSNQFLEIVPIPKEINKDIDILSSKLLKSFNQNKYNEINELIAKSYSLTLNEIEYINKKYKE